MSVLTCDRGRCRNVMCDRYSARHGYICDECFDELVQKGSDTDIEEFMQSDPDESPPRDRSREKWDEEFPLTR